jgi:hypothetical protein
MLCGMILGTISSIYRYIPMFTCSFMCIYLYNMYIIHICTYDLFSNIYTCTYIYMNHSYTYIYIQYVSANIDIALST